LNDVSVCGPLLAMIQGTTDIYEIVTNTVMYTLVSKAKSLKLT
jgi:hypothetical protein